VEESILPKSILEEYILSEAWSGVNWADLLAAQGAFGTDFIDRSIFRPKHRVYYRSGRPVIKIGPKGALASHEIRTIHSAPSLGQSIVDLIFFGYLKEWRMCYLCLAECRGIEL